MDASVEPPAEDQPLLFSDEAEGKEASERPDHEADGTCEDARGGGSDNAAKGGAAEDEPKPMESSTEEAKPEPAAHDSAADGAGNEAVDSPDGSHLPDGASSVEKDVVVTDVNEEAVEAGRKDVDSSDGAGGSAGGTAGGSASKDSSGGSGDSAGIDAPTNEEDANSEGGSPKSSRKVEFAVDEDGKPVETAGSEAGREDSLTLEGERRGSEGKAVETAGDGEAGEGQREDGKQEGEIAGAQDQSEETVKGDAKGDGDVERRGSAHSGGSAGSQSRTPTGSPRPADGGGAGVESKSHTGDAASFNSFLDGSASEMSWGPTAFDLSPLAKAPVSTEVHPMKSLTRTKVAYLRVSKPRGKGPEGIAAYAANDRFTTADLMQERRFCCRMQVLGNRCFRGGTRVQHRPYAGCCVATGMLLARFVFFVEIFLDFLVVLELRRHGNAAGWSYVIPIIFPIQYIVMYWQFWKQLNQGLPYRFWRKNLKMVRWWRPAYLLCGFPGTLLLEVYFLFVAPLHQICHATLTCKFKPPFKLPYYIWRNRLLSSIKYYSPFVMAYKLILPLLACPVHPLEILLIDRQGLLLLFVSILWSSLSMLKTVIQLHLSADAHSMTEEKFRKELLAIPWALVPKENEFRTGFVRDVKYDLNNMATAYTFSRLMMAWRTGVRLRADITRSMSFTECGPMLPVEVCEYLGPRLSDSEKLVRFEMIRCSLAAEQIAPFIAGWSVCPLLVELRFTGNRLNDASARALAHAVNLMPALRTLDLSGCAISGDGARDFAVAIGCNRTIRDLNLDRNDFAGVDFQCLSAIFCDEHPILTDGAFHYGWIVPEPETPEEERKERENMVLSREAEKALEKLKKKERKKLKKKLMQHLTGGGGSKDKQEGDVETGGEPESEFGFRRDAVIEKLSIAHNRAKVLGGQFVAENLMKCKSLKYLDLSNNQMGGGIVAGFVEVVLSTEACPKLEYLALHGNNIPSRGAALIQRAAELPHRHPKSKGILRRRKKGPTLEVTLYNHTQVKRDEFSRVVMGSGARVYPIEGLVRSPPSAKGTPDSWKPVVTKSVMRSMPSPKKVAPQVLVRTWSRNKNPHAWSGDMGSPAPKRVTSATNLLRSPKRV